MKKKVLAGLVGTMLVSSIGFAAPVVELNKGETTIGYSHSNFDLTVNGDSDLGDLKANGYYVQHGLTDKITLGFEKNKGKYSCTDGVDSNTINISFNDIYATYKVAKNAQILLGNRAYKLSGFGTEAGVPWSETLSTENKLMYGIQGTAKLAEKLNGYLGFIKTSEETESKIGVIYAVASNTNLDLNYTIHKWDIDDIDELKFKGIGFGLNYKF